MAAPMDHSSSPPLLPDLGSFSDSWPTNKPLARADDVDIDMHPARQCSFDFSPPATLECSEQAAEMADADQMFCDGLLLPLRFIRRLQEGGDDSVGDPKQDAVPALQRSRSLDSSQRMMATMDPASKRKRHQTAWPTSLYSSPSSPRGAATPSSAILGGPHVRLRLPSFGRCGRVLPRRRLSCRHLSFLAPLYQKMASCVGRRSTTTRRFSGRAADESREGKVLCDVGSEHAISDAILHCKKSLQATLGRG
ncbi:uncharacterized protein LOC102704667 [Oryza brachyantha]|uniref:uncharacterized protein LOC102704667 n=1 Tax=Oryza brachyantha TaxID=4533 RepID=UPI001ADC4458|nr:uncharacterized protein LOC102704667 [Oryza brachyantha]